MPSIKQLPPGVVNKIAAGEVIERPASALKELLENAVDAGATRIDVTVEKGGIDRIRVVDNGCGISRDQLHLAVSTHATSKIDDADDLFRVGTLGFRGEALASIAEISHFRIRSREPDCDAGAELEVVGGEPGPVVPCGTGPGTSVDVVNLFFTTPVRRKFMRTPQTEMGHSTEAFIRVALAHERIHFVLRHGDRTVYDLPATESWRERINTFFGNEIAESLIWIQCDEGPTKLTGFVANPSQSRGNNRMQYLFLNGRYIRDRALGHALGEAYRGLLMTGRYPIVFLRLQIPPDAVDVNVHPTKLEVRFQDSGQIYSQLLGTMRNCFLTTDLTANVKLAVPDDSRQTAESAGNADSAQTSSRREELIAWARGNDIPGDSATAAASRPTFPPPPDRGGGDVAQSTLHFPKPGPSGSLPLSRQADRRQLEQEVHHDQVVDRQNSPESAQSQGPASVRALQLHNRYLITETEDGMTVIDQHALHERILYEELREKVLHGALETQRLLVPEPVKLTSAEAATVLEAKELLAKLGMEVSDFGGGSVLVSTYPAMLANIQPDPLIRQLIEILMSTGRAPGRRDVLDDLLHMISCKAAIKAGDRLTPEEITALLERRHTVQDSHHCPHGRPTSLVFTRDELDRRFKRI